jgi:hypothetical protein
MVAKRVGNEAGDAAVYPKELSDLPARLNDGPLVGATRYLTDGVLGIDGCGSFFLFDLVHSRYQRLPRGSDAWRAIRYGSWSPFVELIVDADGTFTVEPGAGGGPRVRAHAHGAGCGCIDSQTAPSA